ncbi:MAG: hypothetical protein HXX11_01965 [Desulfuromonadales bacterium]|nr:hypothetical protein [Desulfuromonadales bacterium]
MMLVYMACNLAIWKLVTEDLLTGKKCAGGDLARMGYIPESKMCRQNVDSLPRRHIEFANFNGGPVDVVTIGDSFSNGGGGGKDRYYQDHLASQHNFTVLNIPQYKDIDKISTLSILNNNGYLAKLNPQFVVLECAEKMCLQDLPDAIDFDRTLTAAELNKHKTVTYVAVPHEAHIPLINTDFFSEANVKFIKNSLLYNFSDNAYGSPVYKTKLCRPFFSVSKPDILLFVNGDIKDRKKFTIANITRLNTFLNTLSDRLKAKGISLYFMPCVDKYNLYSEYIPDNPYPRSTFFEVLRKMPRRFELIDTKEILREEIAKGEKDVYYSDDTHWSWKASKRIFEQVEFH